MFLDKDRMKDKGFLDDEIQKYEKLFDFRDLGLCCLSAQEVNYLPMWAYYTNNHKGFCIEYELVRKHCIHEVMYETKRIPIASLFIQLKDALKDAAKYGQKSSSESETIAHLFMKILYIKSKSWEHEREFRIVQPISNEIGENIQISNIGLRVNRVIAGIECSVDNKRVLNDISNQIGCGNAYVAKLSSINYTLVEERM